MQIKRDVCKRYRFVVREGKPGACVFWREHSHLPKLLGILPNCGRFTKVNE